MFSRQIINQLLLMTAKFTFYGEFYDRNIVEARRHVLNLIMQGVDPESRFLWHPVCVLRSRVYRKMAK